MKLDNFGISDEIIGRLDELDEVMVNASEPRGVMWGTIESYLAKHNGKPYQNALREEAWARYCLSVVSECA